MNYKNYQLPQYGNFEGDDAEGNVFTIKDFFNKLRSLWLWVILSAAFFVTFATFYLKVTSPLYKIHATLLVQDEQKSSGLLAAASAIQDLGGLGGKSNVDNEALILKSRSPMEKTVLQLQLFVGYQKREKFKKSEIYIGRPIDFSFNTQLKLGTTNLPYQVLINKTNRSFIISNLQKSYQGNLGDSIKLPEGTALVTAGPGFEAWPANDLLILSISSFDGTVAGYMGALSTDLPNKLTSIINLTLVEQQPGKGELVLNELINQYLKASLDDKNRIADSTMSFIDARLALVSNELEGIENNIEQFKISNKLTDISQQSTLLLKNNSENIQKETSLQVELSVVQDLEVFLTSNVNDRKTVPSSLVMTDQNFVSLIKAYNDLQLLRDRRLMSQTEGNPAILIMDQQLHNLRQNLLSSIASIKRGIETSVTQLAKYTAGFEAQISTVPSKERKFLGFSRQQAIKQELYIFLLTKREETAVSKSSSLATTRIVDSAKADGGPFSPNRNSILMIALFAGLALPFAISFGRDLLNTRVLSVADIGKVTKAPILSEIGHNPTNDIFAIKRNSRTAIAESLRALRTHLQFLLPNEEDKTILFTSSMGEEGKSFLSINLAQALVLAHKKVILLDLDLRKPKIDKNLALEKKGFTNYIVGKNDNWQQYIQQAGDYTKFDVLCAGPVPPNPSELLLLPKMNVFMQELHAIYDYIIIDTAPIGLVTDAEVLAPFINLTLFVVRHNYTLKERLQTLDSLYKRKLLPNLNVLVNDIKYSKKGYGGYNTTYGYGYYGTDKTALENVEEELE